MGKVPTTDDRSLRGALRIAWVLLAVLLFAAFYGGSVAWLPIVGLPWLAGAVVVLRAAWSTRAARSWSAVSTDPLVRACLACWGGVVGLLAVVLSAAAGLLAATCLAATALLIAAFGKPRPLKDALIGGCVVALTLCVTLGAAEAVFRLPALQRQFGLPDELRAWESRYDQLESRNVLGLRSVHEVVPKPPGTVRVLALGDSYTWGDKVAVTDSTWPAVLEKRLRVRWPTIQVVNLGQSGFTTANEAELLSRLGWQMCPDLVIIQFNWNDVLPSSPNFGRVGGQWLHTPVRLLPQRFRSGPVASSAFLGFVEGQLDKIWRKLRPPRSVRDLYHRDFEGWRQMQAAVAYVGASSRSRSVPVVLVMQPFLLAGSWTIESYPLRDIFDKVAALAETHGLKVLDLTPTFAQAGGDWQRWHATPYDAHPGAAAHALTASAIADLIEEHYWVADPDSATSRGTRSEASEGPLCDPVDDEPFMP